MGKSTKLTTGLLKLMKAYFAPPVFAYSLGAKEI